MPRIFKGTAKQRSAALRKGSARRKAGATNYRLAIPRTIQSAAWKPRSVTVRHFYQNSFKVASTDLWSTTEKNTNIKFTPNSCTIFENQALPTEWEPATAINPIYGTAGVTTYQDLQEYQTAYRRLQVLGVRYDINVRIIKNLSAEDEAFEYPLKLIVSRLTTHPAHAADFEETAESLEDRPYTTSKVMQQGPGVVSKGVNFVIRHSARKANSVPKASFLNHVDYTPDITQAANLGAVTTGTRLNGVPEEQDWIGLYVTSASQAAAVISPELLVTMKASYVVRYSEPSYITNESYPIKK